MARKKEAPHPENHERWLVTYADLITLLMVFFVIMYSMSQVDVSKFRAMADALSVSLGGSITDQLDISENPQGPSLIEEGVPEEPPGQEHQGPEQESIEDLKGKLDSFAQENGIHAQLVSDIEERGLVISIQETLLFDSGSATLSTQAHAMLRQISVILASSPNFIRVEGHTDNIPITSGRFPSNWELSAMRATNVIHLLGSENVDVKRLSAAGYGQHRPLASNDTPEGRARNRRVDLVVLRSLYNAVEPNSNVSFPGTPEMPGAVDLTEQMNQ